jgi:hypothetical protein
MEGSSRHSYWNKVVSDRSFQGMRRLVGRTYYAYASVSLNGYQWIVELSMMLGRIVESSRRGDESQLLVCLLSFPPHSQGLTSCGERSTYQI